ncbi:MAG: DUF116 domain-containing protein [Candidatus Magnetoovum sp. WYHC-5]|nr:DUF116 domain-containing protein [Candidatus Magnetoovum sp. WYHC-5]
MLVKGMRGFVLKVLYPFLMFLGAIKKDKKEWFQRSIISLNNRLVVAEGGNVKKILILLPHCIQINKCDVRITNSIYNCKRCGKCAVKDLIGIAERNNMSIHIATGGTLARKIVFDVRPDAVVAVACERDLSSGIVDAYPMRVIGVHNERPNGPCFDTVVDVNKVELAINTLLRKT